LKKDAKEDKEKAKEKLKKDAKEDKEKAKMDEKMAKEKLKKDAKEEKMNEKMAKWYNERKDFVGMKKPSPSKDGQTAYAKWRRWYDPALGSYAGARYDVEKAKAAWEASDFAKGGDAAVKGDDDDNKVMSPCDGARGGDDDDDDEGEGRFYVQVERRVKGGFERVGFKKFADVQKAEVFYKAECLSLRADSTKMRVEMGECDDEGDPDDTIECFHNYDEDAVAKEEEEEEEAGAK
jgi:hypothetical protein